MTRAKRSSAQGQIEILRAYKTVFDSEAGRIVLDDILTATRYFAVTPPGKSPDERAYADGAREAARHILAKLKVTPEEMGHLYETARRTSLEENGFL